MVISAAVNQNEFSFTPAVFPNNSGMSFNLFFLNAFNQEKIGVGHIQGNNVLGTGDTGNRRVQAFKWANTTDLIDTISFFTVAGSSNASSFFKVWGAN